MSCARRRRGSEPALRLGQAFLHASARGRQLKLLEDDQRPPELGLGLAAGAQIQLHAALGVQRMGQTQAVIERLIATAGPPKSGQSAARLTAPSEQLAGPETGRAF